MIKILFLFLFILNTSICFAGDKYYFSPENGRYVFDNSITESEIREQFDFKGEIQEFDVEENEGVKIVNGQFVKFDLAEEAQRIEREKKDKEGRVKQKLGLTNAEFKELKEALE